MCGPAEQGGWQGSASCGCHGDHSPPVFHYIATSKSLAWANNIAWGRIDTLVFEREWWGRVLRSWQRLGYARKHHTGPTLDCWNIRSALGSSLTASMEDGKKIILSVFPPLIYLTYPFECRQCILATIVEEESTIQRSQHKHVHTHTLWSRPWFCWWQLHRDWGWTWRQGEAEECRGWKHQSHQEAGLPRREGGKLV